MKPQKKIEKILKEIEKGRRLESDTDTLMKILSENPSITPDVIKSLSIIMGKVDQKPYISACLVLNSIADHYLDKVSELFEMTIGILKYREKEIDENEWIPTLELFTKMHQGYPEKMRIVIPGLFDSLEDLFLNHLDTNLRSEAGFTADKIRPICAPKKPDAIRSSDVSKKTGS